MTTKTRASIFDADEIDLSGFAPKAEPDSAAPTPEQVRAVSEAANFRSREPVKPRPSRQPVHDALSDKRPPRRHRTGRNVQFNIKTSQETLDAFYEIADGKGWVLGETLERAIAALRRELTGKG